ncbi:NAD(P)-binding protein [Chitinimonas sp. PSY-7]|uniref:NAD(P)-binding protein n=1 Tax=Chitinimonas sp. PSY-7 TaxID=3459088 RepID=UPI00404001B2
MEAGTTLKRRTFLAAAGSLGLLACKQQPADPIPPGQLLGPNLKLGHHLRDRKPLPAATETRCVGALVVGAGMAGLSCGWWLQRHGEENFTVLELEDEAGGNARSGRNRVSAYPWGAHYLPIPGEDATEIRLLLAELGALRGDPAAPKPEYEERYLCNSPQERLYINGRWQEGLLPQFGVSTAEQTQQQRFIAQVSGLKAERGINGARRFTIPSARGCTIPTDEARISMRDWLLANAYTAPSLHWWVNYGCRDDFGTDYTQTSAWAGLHYFAGRHGEAANAEPDEVLTWPEGNAWITQRMAQQLGPHLQTGALVWHIEELANGLAVDAYLPQEQRSVRYLADRLVWAGQLGFLPHIWPELPTDWRGAISQISYAPWIVANLTLPQQPSEPSGQHAPLSWDNVLYQAQGLGYVHARHQNISLNTHATVISYYRPLSEYRPATARSALQQQPREFWGRQILADLGRVHPEIARECLQLDVWRWGHAMVRPTPALMSGNALPVLRKPSKRVILAHSDLSGFSLAEEANYWGVYAARWLLGKPGGKT